MKNEKTQTTHYELTESIINSENGAHKTYGIKGNSVSFDDVSTDRNRVEEMTERLNKEQLEESQFLYFVSDEIDR